MSREGGCVGVAEWLEIVTHHAKGYPRSPRATVLRSGHSSGVITGVLTSCNRHDLLVETLESFFRTNTLPLERFIVVEDGPDVPSNIRGPFADHGIEWISTGKRVGQIAAIDYAYSRVTTPYIFHLEDDWLFYRPGYMERSLVVLESDAEVLQVWLRPVGYVQDHPIEPKQFVERGVEWRRLAHHHELSSGYWHGFSFNPGLRRLRDYIAIDGYGIHTKGATDAGVEAENLIGEIYRRRGLYAAILTDTDGAGYARHMGQGRRVQPLRVVAT